MAERHGITKMLSSLRLQGGAGEQWGLGRSGAQTFPQCHILVKYVEVCSTNSQVDPKVSQFETPPEPGFVVHA